MSLSYYLKDIPKHYEYTRKPPDEGELAYWGLFNLMALLSSKNVITMDDVTKIYERAGKRSAGLVEYAVELNKK